MADSTTDTPVLDLLASMTADSIEASGLDPETLMLVRIAALAAVDAPPVSYALNLRLAGARRIRDGQHRQGDRARDRGRRARGRCRPGRGQPGRPVAEPRRKPARG